MILDCNVTDLKQDFADSCSGFALTPSVWFFAGQVDESEPVRHVPVQAFPFIVGRRADLQLALPCPCVSKEHAEIFVQNEQLWVRDLNSTNGTYLNGELVTDTRPLKEGDLLQFATVVFRVGREQQATESNTLQENTCDRALAMMQFDRLISDGGVVPFFQPIVQTDSQKIIGFEVLGRSRLFGLTTPKEMFAAASQLNLEAELSRVFRRVGIEEAKQLPGGYNIFVNTHPAELEDDLEASLKELRELSEDKITLEIHEAAVTDQAIIRRIRSMLHDFDMELAFDDFGAGQARLVELGEVQPDYLKFDIGLVKGISQAPASRQELLAALVRIVNDLGITSLAEGVETPADDETLTQMGFTLGQGYFYGRPANLRKCLEALEMTL